MTSFPNCSLIRATVFFLLAAAGVIRAEDYAITTFAGVSLTSGSADGTPGTFNNPYGIAIDSAKNLYIADTLNNTIRKITPGRVVSTLAGTAGQSGSADGTGSAARFNFPVGVAVDSSGNVYVADAKNFTIRKITPAGVVSTLAGAPFQLGSADGTGSAARFFLPYGVAVDGAGNVYVTDGGNQLIRKITPAGVVSTLAGGVLQSGYADGAGSAARFNTPWGITVDGSGNLFVSDSENHVIRKITPSGVVSTVAGVVGVTGAQDGTGAAARFNQPRGLSVDASGNVFVADHGNSVIRQISPSGVVTTIAGSAGIIGDADSVGAAARFYYTTDVVVDGTTIYVVDSSNNLIRRGVPRSAAPLPTINLHPIDQEVSVGQAVSFRVVASGSNLTYQWFKSGTPIIGATGATYTIAAAQSDDIAVYTARVSGAGGGIDSNPGTLSVNPVGTGAIAITARPLSQAVDVGQNATFSVTATGNALTYQWLKNGATITGATASTYTVTSAQTADAGLYAVRITSGSTAETASAKLIVGGSTGSGATVTITTEPLPQAVETGQSATFSVTASGTGLTYQWFKDGVAIAGANSSTLTITNAQSSQAGSYFVRVSSGVVSADSRSVTLTVSGGPVIPVGPTARLSNLSVRTAMAAGQTLIVGVFVEGGPRNILVRAAGPALAAFGLSTAMVDPRLELYNGTQLVFENNDWPANLAETFANVGAFVFPPNSRDAAFVQSIEGGRSIQVRGTAAGVVLVEAYDIGTGNTPRLLNVSARNRVGTGDDILIAGFNVAGTGTKQLLIRAVGPKLAAFGVTGGLNDPKLELYAANGAKLNENDNWSASLAPTFTSVGAFQLDPGSKDAALLTTLEPGTYTVQVRGADGGTGEGLIEIYEVP
jgi:sugar lactone lactonase YvrE